MSHPNAPVRAPARVRTPNDAEVDAWLRIVTGGVDLSGVELRYTLLITVEPWVAEFARIVSEELRNAGRVRRDR
ncbi:MAG TPA: hypothetical protein VMG60_18585 [Burkholderiaceae bacterium]|nr:hypothetical protein [Burkholderiaceae bacterium]